MADSPAEQAGLEAGDVILSVGGTTINGPDDLQEAVTDREPGDQVEIRFRRGADTRTATATLASR